MGRSENDEPTLPEAWSILAERLGLTVEDRGGRAVSATGRFRGRPITVEIDGKGARSEFARFFFGIATLASRNRREKWHTSVVVGITNPRGLIGTIESAVDVHDPDWQPGHYDPRQGRHVRCDPPSLADHVLTAATHELLMSITDDVRIDIGARSIGIDHHGTARPGSGAQYVAGSVIHHHQGPVLPWPERALVGPPWWISLLCDLADAVDA